MPKHLTNEGSFEILAEGLSEMNASWTSAFFNRFDGSIYQHHIESEVVSESGDDSGFYWLDYYSTDSYAEYTEQIGSETSTDVEGVMHRYYGEVLTYANTSAGVPVWRRDVMKEDYDSAITTITRTSTRIEQDATAFRFSLNPGRVNPTEFLKIVVEQVPTYSDNATAKAAGLELYQIYKTATGQLMIVY